jgi:hypothetical protein
VAPSGALPTIFFLSAPFPLLSLAKELAREFLHDSAKDKKANSIKQCVDEDDEFVEDLQDLVVSLS